jgi:hypothetical protein
MAGFEMRRKLPNRIGWVIFSALGFNLNGAVRERSGGLAALGSPNAECRLMEWSGRAPLAPE